ncbi:hypothetical protein [Longitalea arenae]|uniref:hypothetical protein n=1 Tax=Longitalea arenae TaxID=2812558 RepID=UPI00196784EA|nr:hypothetical protein [Longitalea arenae]
MQRISAWVILILVTTFISCRKNDLSSNTNGSSSTTDKELYNTLLQAGIPANRIEDKGEHYVVSGDLYFKKGSTDLNQVKAYFKKGPREEQRQFHTLNTDIAESLRTRIDLSLFHTWEFPARLAMQAWANVPNCKVNFLYVNPNEPPGSEDLVIVPDNGTLDENVIAAADFPAGGNTWRIRINTNFYDQPGQNVHPDNRGSNMIYNMAHEIGHVLGFHHTNESWGWQIPGTPGIGGDPASVMNGGTALHLWNGLSANDVAGVQWMHPYNPLDNWITAPQVDFHANWLLPIESYAGIEVTWNASLVSTSTVTLQIYKNRALLGTVASGIPNNGHFSFTEGHYNSFFPPMSDHSGVQFRIISDANASQSDYSCMFFLNWE